MTRRFQAAVAGAIAAAAFGLVGCRDATAPVTPIAIQRVAVDITAGGDILLHVALSEAATVQVDYWDSPSHRLRIVAPATTADFTVLVPVVRAGEHYEFEVSVPGRVAGSGVARGTFETPALASDLAQVLFDATGHATAPLTMLEVNGPYRGFVAIDETGAPVWWWRTQGLPQGFTRRANGNFVFNDAGHGLFEVQPDGQVVHQLPPLPNGDGTPHHDVVATGANTLLFLAQDTRAVGGAPIVGDAIWEWAPESNQVVKRWSVFDFYDPATDVGARSVSWDWVHANSLAIGAHGNVILSLNWLDQVISIAPDWRSIEWKAGGRGSSFTLDADASFQGQHSAAVLPDGHLLLFDNGRDRASPAAYSRGLELVLDPVSHAAHRAWSFRPTPDIYAPYIGSARRLASGHTLVFFGLPSGFSGGATGPVAGYEVTGDGSVVWSVTVGNVKSVYRATPLSSIAGERAVP